jgi:hypothetical protein
MPEGPRREKRPAEAIGSAVMISKIAFGEVKDERQALPTAAAWPGRKDAKERAQNMLPEWRAKMARRCR